MNAYISDVQVCVAAKESFGLCSTANFLHELTGYAQSDFEHVFDRAARKGLVNVYGRDTVLISGKGSLFLQSQAIEDHKWRAVERVKQRLVEREERRRWDVRQLIKSKMDFARELRAA
ncbi:hypothetical protein D7Y51_09715 [Stenotrophomonas maltophilia]|uniref:hypothetical protein n=1 Tax=Stenotrophomonas maltophilia TaxID=40324 RepID=UPI000ADA06E1|nr:hypothetical protein [Stenotrophomonas maltophilia]MBA0443372.1 hypothetical protein [Stenotrophomonas maltophilia]